MAALSDFSQLVRIFVPGAPDPTIEFAVRESARRFCSLSWFARRSIIIVLVDGQETYTVTPSSSEEEVVGVHAVEFRNRPLGPTKPELVATSEGTPQAFYFEPSNSLTLDPYPDSDAAGENIIVRIATQPTLTTETIADDIVREYRQCIANGAIAWLMNVPKQPWTDQQMAQNMERKFLAQTMRAKEAILRGHQPWGIDVRRPAFAVR